MMSGGGTVSIENGEFQATNVHEDSAGEKSIDDIWKSMKDLDVYAKEEYKKRSKMRSSKGIVMEEKIAKKSSGKKSSGRESSGAGGEKKGKKKEKVGQKEGNVAGGTVMEGEETARDEETNQPPEKIEITAQEYLKKIARDLNLIESVNLSDRKRSMELIWRQLSDEYSMSTIEYNDLMSEMARPIFKKFADSTEKIRDLAFRITKLFFERASDFVPILGYFIPALLQRVPSTLAYDQDLQIFVSDIESHQAYKRGRAVDRQDKKDTSNISVIETSEEIRLLMCQCLGCLSTRLSGLQALSVLNPYFSDVILYLQAQVRDPYAEVKIEALRQIEFFAGQAEYEHGMCYFAVALCRCILPHLRHRHAKVRAAAVDAYRACVHVPNREKRKGAGTETITELIGFREENVLPVAAFYQPDVSVNFLAELSSDPTSIVRERVALMLNSFLTQLEDKYDHQTRLLPYLLDLLGDEQPSIQQIALTCLTTCGTQYEQDHPDDIIEKRQYGIDGDDRCNYDKPLPAPFSNRPRIGVRLYVRGNTKRFLFSLISELTNWQNKTRIKSAKLLKYIIILCEEHLTMEAHKLIPTFIKALHYARDGGSRDKELEDLMLEICELCGRYVVPDTYVHYILPRLRGDADVVQFGVDSLTRCCVMDTLRCMINGSKANLLSPLFTELVSCLIDPFVIDIESLPVHQTALQLLNELLQKIEGKGLAAVEAHYQLTGRLKSLKQAISDAFKFLFVSLYKPDLRALASVGLISLSGLDYDTRATGIKGLISGQVPHLLNDMVSGDIIEDPLSPEIQLFELILVAPWFPIQCDLPSFIKTVEYLTGSISKLSISHGQSTSSFPIHSLHPSSNILQHYCHLLQDALRPIFSSTVPLSKHFRELYRTLSNSSIDDSHILTEGCLRPTKLNELLIEDLLRLLTISPHWNESLTLQETRLNLLALTLCENLNENEETLHPFVRSLLGGIYSDLFAYVFPPTSNPTAPLNIRLKSIQLLGYVIRCSIPETRVISYSRMTPPTCFLPSPILLSLLDHLTLISLNDSSDEIRIPSLEILLQVVPFIPKDKLESSSSKFCHFEGMIECLLNQTMNGNPTEEVFVHLDLVLRSIAILDPTTFEQLIRAKFATLSSSQRASESLLEFYSGLIDHVDVLIQFQAFKAPQVPSASL